MKYLGLFVSGIVLTLGSLILGISFFVYESEAAPDTTVAKVTPLETLVLAIPVVLVFLIGIFFLVYRYTKIKKEVAQTEQTPAAQASS